MTNYTNVHDFKEDHKSHHHRVKGDTPDMPNKNGRKKYKKRKGGKETKKRKKRKQETKKRKRSKCDHCARTHHHQSWCKPELRGPRVQMPD